MARIAQRQRPALEQEFRAAAARLQREIMTQAYDHRRNTLVSSYGGTELDAALLQAVTLRLLPPHDPRMAGTVDAVQKALEHEGWLRRYARDDGFGVPTVAFVICTFWLVEALSTIGRIDEAREIMERVGTVRAPLGLIAEDVDPKSGEMWGNFPQAYSHVGLIHAAFAASPRWADVE
jgi:GH15 family glucan-1,4-alpha-glucosidase